MIRIDSRVDGYLCSRPSSRVSQPLLEEVRAARVGLISDSDSTLNGSGQPDSPARYSTSHNKRTHEKKTYVHSPSRPLYPPTMKRQPPQAIREQSACSSRKRSHVPVPADFEPQITDARPPDRINRSGADPHASPRHLATTLMVPRVARWGEWHTPH